MVDPSVLGLIYGGGGHLMVDDPTSSGVAGPTSTAPVNGVAANVSTNLGGSVVGGVVIALAIGLFIVYYMTRGRQH